MPSPLPISFERLAALPDNDIDVALGAVLIARDVYPDLDIERTLARFDALAQPLERLDLSHAHPRLQAEHLRNHLHEACGFNGNERDYYDLRNSLISDVLDRRLGIPITLSVVYCEVARRAGVAARGVSFPGHFLVRIDPSTDLLDEASAKDAVVVDPFFGCRVLDENALSELFAKNTGAKAGEGQALPAPPSAVLLAASPRAILQRMLVNLRAIYLSRGDEARALLAIDRILCLTPAAPEALRERGLLSARLGAREQALVDLERYLELAPQSEEAAHVRTRITELRKRGGAGLN